MSVWKLSRCSDFPDSHGRRAIRRRWSDLRRRQPPRRARELLVRQDEFARSEIAKSNDLFAVAITGFPRRRFALGARRSAPGTMPPAADPPSPRLRDLLANARRSWPRRKRSSRKRCERELDAARAGSARIQPRTFLPPYLVFAGGRRSRASCRSNRRATASRIAAAQRKRARARERHCFFICSGSARKTIPSANLARTAGERSKDELRGFTLAPQPGSPRAKLFSSAGPRTESRRR